MAKTNAASNLVLQWLLNTGTAPTRPAGCYLGLLTAAANIPAGTVTEVSGGSYARQNLAGLLTAPSAGSTNNNATVSFAGMPACTVTHVAYYDAASAGNLLEVIALTSSQTVQAGNTVQFSATTGLTVTES
jgi:hypothetical protein